MDDLAKMIRDFGFPIAVAVWLLWQQREHARRCEKDNDDLWAELKRMKGEDNGPTD